MTKNVIQLNGNTYDIQTGKLVTAADSSSPTAPPAKPNQNRASTSSSVARQSKRPAHHPVQNPASKQPRKADTLMRTSVKKPQKNQSADGISAPSVQRRKMLDTPRFERANRVNKSEHVHKFSPQPSQSSPQTTPDASPQQEMATQQPTSSPPTARRTDPVPTPRQALEQSALARAESHNQTAPTNPTSTLKRLWRRLLDAPAGLRYTAASLLLIGGLATIAYASLPYMSVQLASSRSEVSASLPDYKPSGFQLSGNVEYSPDHVALQYHSISDSRSFRINKQKTDWNSDSLRTSFVEEKGLYQTIPSNEKTIYIYNESNATWIDNDVWYTIEGASSLSSDQLLRLANSL